MMMSWYPQDLGYLLEIVASDYNVLFMRYVFLKIYSVFCFLINPFPALIKSEYSHILFKKFITHEPYIKNTCNKVPQVEPDLSHSWNHHCCLATNHHPTNNNC